MIKTIIFDMGGVILLNDINQVYIQLAKSLNISGDALVKLIKKNRLDFMNGKFTGKKFSLLIKKHFNLLNNVETIMQYWKNAFEDLMVVNQELINTLPKLKKNYIVCMVTDVPELHAKINKNKGLYNQFKPCILSSDVGFVKPQKEIFKLAIDELQLDPKDCIFIDDERANIQIGKKFGFKTILFKDNNQLFKDFRKLEVKI